MTETNLADDRAPGPMGLGRALAVVRETFEIPKHDVDLMRSQLAALSRQIPLLYFILLANSCVLMWTYYGVAPLSRTVAFPALLTIACIVRFATWPTRSVFDLSPAQVVRRLRTSVLVTVGFGVCFLTGSLSLYPYGDAAAQGHIAFFIGVTVIACTFCLMQLRPAALLLNAVVVGPFVAFLLGTGRPVFVAVAIDMLFVSIATIYMVLGYSRDFATMISSKRELIRSHAAETELVRANAEARFAAQQESLRHAERFEAALDNMSQGLCMFDAEDRLIICNAQYRKMYDLPDELAQTGVHWRDLIAHRVARFGFRDLDLDDVLAHHQSADPRLIATSATRALCDGRTIFVSKEPIKGGGWVATHEDITERRRAEDRLAHMARHDALTGVGNRFLLQERLEQAVAGLSRGGQFAVLFIDLDHFKATNDALGHIVGDALLREVAARLLTCVLGSDTIVRTGGDEFAIVQTAMTDPEEAGDLAQAILAALSRTFIIDEHRIDLGASVGIACAPRDATAAAMVLRLADIALFRAKSEGRRAYRFFEASMDAELQAQRQLAKDLRAALVKEEFELYFQPINDAKTRAIRSFEALVRWRHPVRGMVSPDEFISLAEETDLIVPLGDWVLKAACRQATHWPEDVRVSVNLSALQFNTGSLVKTIRATLAEAGLPPERLELEITESVLLEGSTDNLAILHELRGMGVKIAMDDFGTGYSSLSYLRSFPFDKIKIDQSFVKNIDERDAREIVRAIAGLGQTLGMATTAEGVETHEQLQSVIAYGCTEVQGYFFTRPVPASAVDRLLEVYHRPRQVA
jgi:diguanylate cyclase (GGDEF)-like protein